MMQKRPPNLNKENETDESNKTKYYHRITWRVEVFIVQRFTHPSHHQVSEVIHFHFYSL